MLNNNGLKTVESIAKCGLKILGMFMLTGLLTSKTKDVVTYTDAVKAVVSSSLLGSDKAKVMAVLKPGLKEEQYKAVIYVLNASLLGSDRVKLINEILKEGEA